MRISYGSSDVYSSDLYRRLLMGGFMPKKVRQYSEVARETAQALVAALKPRGECEFIDEFAKVLPINVFLTMMGLPLDDRAFLSKIFAARRRRGIAADRSEEHTSELQSLMRISYAVFCLKKKTPRQ